MKPLVNTSSAHCVFSGYLGGYFCWDVLDPAWRRRKNKRAGGGALCAQMDFTRTFEANAKCNNINHVWSHFYTILVVLKYNRCPCANIFDTDICRSINISKNAKYTPLMLVFMHLKMFVSKILFHRHLWYFRTTKIW